MKVAGSYPGERLGRFSSSIRSWFLRPKTGVDDLLTPLTEALSELEKRRQDSELRRRVSDYLGDRVPSYFQGSPVLYLARHLATPNFETIRFSQLLHTHDLPVVIGQDIRDKFVPQNILKRCLGRLPIHVGSTHKGGKLLERYQKVTIVDFNTASGRPFSEIETIWGERLTDFHAGLCNRYLAPGVRVVDDSEWISQNSRGDLIEHYKVFLALFVMHGILFEDFLAEDKNERQFIERVLRPAFAFVADTLGARPLITHLQPTSLESETFWMSYPRTVLDVVNGKIAQRSP